MRSTVPPLEGGGDDDDHRKELFSSVYWWRSLPEFDGLERPEVFSTRASGCLTPRLRVVRELERLAVVAHESLDDLRHKLLSYRAGDLWFPAGGIPKQETDIPPVVTILLLGFAGSGKSSLINLMYSVFGRSGFVPSAHTASPAGKDGRTQYLEEHNVLRSMRNGFCIFDSRGLDYDRVAEGLDEVAEWMFRENPILVLTHGDELTAEERIETRVRLCEYQAVSETAGVYDVVCVNEHGLVVDDVDPVTAYAVAEAIYRALLLADQGHPPKPNVKDFLILVLSWAMCILSAFFAFLSACCSKVARASREQKFRQQ